MEARIKIEHLSHVYGSKSVFDDLSFEVGAEEAVSIVGPSGCGKTTLLRCVAGLTPATSGTVVVSGQKVTEPPDGTAMVFQHFGLFPWMSVASNVAYGLTVRGVKRRESAARVKELIGLVGLSGFEDAYPYQLSGGMRQRAGLARALAVEPNVLLMDEPFAALDAQTREVLQFEVMRILSLRPTTMLFVTHSIDEAVLVGDRVVILRGQPSQIYDICDIHIKRPRNREVLDTSEFRRLREYVWSAIMTRDDMSEAPEIAHR